MFDELLPIKNNTCMTTDTFPDYMVRKKFLVYISVDIHPMKPMAKDNEPETVMEMQFLSSPLILYLLPDR